MQISDQIIYKNNQLLAFNKLGGIPVQPDKTGDTSLTDLASIYSKVPVFATHRIDRPASGIVLFARNKRSLALLNEQFKKRTIDKTYLAVVKKLPAESFGELVHHIYVQGNNKTVALKTGDKKTKEARMNYKLIASSDNYHLLEIKLLTGRQHQIRAQLAAIGSPIKGDVKYGARRGNKDRSIQLHSWKMAFDHPITGERVSLQAPIPEGGVWEAFKEQVNNGLEKNYP